MYARESFYRHHLQLNRYSCRCQCSVKKFLPYKATHQTSYPITIGLKTICRKPRDIKKYLLTLDHQFFIDNSGWITETHNIQTFPQQGYIKRYR